MEVPARPALLLIAEIALFLVLFGWLAAAAAIVEVELYDGWDAVSNARLFFGTTSEAGYIPNRAPLMAWLLMPGEGLRLLAGSDPLNPRPYHVICALLHAVYLLGVYWILCRIYDRGWPVLVSFVIAVPTFLFFAGAPFVSLDILPGFALLLMTLWLGRWLESPSLRVWLALVALGAASALLKQTYALFWVALLIACCALWWVPAWRASVPSRRGAAWIVGGACLSGLITWLVLASVLGRVFGFGETPFWLRPWFQVHTITIQTPEAPWWIYLRNAPAFGLLTVLLLVPGWWLSRRSAHPAVRLSLVTLPLLIVLMQLNPYREVRYLIFLSPVAALLIVPAVSQLLRRRWTTAALSLLLVFELFPPFPWARVPEAVRIAQPFYRHSELLDFIKAFRAHRDGTVFYQGANLGYRPPTTSKLVGDRRHEIFHFGPHQLYNLEQLGSANFVLLKPLETATAVPPGSLVVGATADLLNVVSWSHSARDEPADRANFIAKSAGLRVRASDGGYVTDRGPVEFSEIEGEWILGGAPLSEILQGCVLPRIVAGDRIVAELQPRADGRFVVEGRWADQIEDVGEFLVTAQRIVFRQTSKESYEVSIQSSILN